MPCFIREFFCNVVSVAVQLAGGTEKCAGGSDVLKKATAGPLKTKRLKQKIVELKRSHFGGTLCTSTYTLQ